MQEQPRQSAYRHLLDDRRASTRMPKEPDTDFAAIFSEDGEPLLAEVHDESLGGLCLVLEDVATYPIASEAEILYQSTLLCATVRHIEPRCDGKFLVGFECHPLA